MPKFLLLFLLLALLFSCSKKKRPGVWQDLSIATTSSLNKILPYGDRSFICGGTRFERSLLYILEVDNDLLQLPIPANSSQKELFALSANASGHIIAVSYDAGILWSRDSGLSWEFRQNSSWTNFQDIAFRDEDSAIVLSNTGFQSGAMHRFDAEGQSGNLPYDSRNFALDDIDFIDAQTGYVCGYGAILRTRDGGQRWDFTGAENDYFKSMCWKNANEGIAVGYAGSILKTVDGGDHWERIRNGDQFLKKKIHFLTVESDGQNTCIAIGEKGVVYYSKDFGSQWEEIETPTHRDLKGLAYRTSGEWLICGSQGALFLLKI